MTGAGVLNTGGMVKPKVFLSVLIACILAASYAAAQAPSQRAPRGGPPLTADQPKQQAAPAAPAQPAVPVTPLSPEQMPSSPPQVSFNSGILTIIANNSTLGDILRAVHRQTGAAVDTPGNATERVVGKFGPGPARDVLSSLLNGSHFNYVLLGSATSPTALDRVMLISRSIAGEDSSQQANAAVPANSARPAAAMPQPAESAESPNEDAGEMPQDTADTAEEQANQEQQQPEDQQQPQQAAPFGQAGAVKTPEQLLQELQQRQQQQQQQPGAPQSFPPAPVGGAQPAQPPH